MHESSHKASMTIIRQQERIQKLEAALDEIRDLTRKASKAEGVKEGIEKGTV